VDAAEALLRELVARDDLRLEPLRGADTYVPSRPRRKRSSPADGSGDRETLLRAAREQPLSVRRVTELLAVDDEGALSLLEAMAADGVLRRFRGIDGPRFGRPDAREAASEAPGTS
jgi:hypothetical protein